MIEREVLQKKPNIEWDAIAGLKEAKSLLQEAVVLPNIVPDFFKVLDSAHLLVHR
jgi:katanin p60 ATPase-containing subunit A1